MEFLKAVRKNKLALIGMVIISVFTLMAVGAPLIASHDPTDQNLEHVLQTPDKRFILGTDELGRDIFSRVIWGARNSLIVGILVVLLGGSLGVLVGIISGYYGGPVDTVLMRIMDTMMSFPTILLSLLIVTIIGIGLEGAIIAVGLASVPRFARISRGSVLSVKEKEYIEAAQVLGQNNVKILLKHVLPNCLAPIIVQTTLTIGNSILVISSLGFLGLGAKPGEPEWGVMLSNARSFLRSAPHIAMFPGLAIAFTVLGFNLLGDGLRDVFDVRQK